MHRIQVFETDASLQFCNNHPDLHIAQTCFENISPPDLHDEYVDLHRIQVFEIDAWLQFCNNRPDMHIAQTCFENISSPELADEYGDLHMQARRIGSFGPGDDVRGSNECCPLTSKFDRQRKSQSEEEHTFDCHILAPLKQLLN